MASTLAAQPRILHCPSCGEMIYSDTTKCRFCSAPIDTQAAEAAADVQKQVNDAVNMAKWIRNAAGAMWGLVGLGLIFGFASLAAIVCVFLIPISLIYWQISCTGLKTVDADYAKTKRDRMIALLLWASAALIEGLIITVRVIGA